MRLLYALALGSMSVLPVNAQTYTYDYDLYATSYDDGLYAANFAVTNAFLAKVKSSDVRPVVTAVSDVPIEILEEAQTKRTLIDIARFRHVLDNCDVPRDRRISGVSRISGVIVEKPVRHYGVQLRWTCIQEGAPFYKFDTVFIIENRAVERVLLYPEGSGVTKAQLDQFLSTSKNPR